MQGGPANLAFAQLVVEESRAARPLTLDQLLVLNQLWYERRITTAEAARLSQKSESEARATLNRLVEAGLVEARGIGRARSWLLSGDVYRRADATPGYARQRGLDRSQQEAAILEHARMRGSIGRREAAELCGLTGSQSYRLLRSLVARGLLEQTRKRGRWVRYRPPQVR
jgi:ATP-dependent DNA helicase RecG